MSYPAQDRRNQERRALDATASAAMHRAKLAEQQRDELLAVMVQIADPLTLRTAESFRMLAKSAITKATKEAS